jgi:hypothetical protein
MSSSKFTPYIIKMDKKYTTIYKSKTSLISAVDCKITQPNSKEGKAKNQDMS